MSKYINRMDNRDLIIEFIETKSSVLFDYINQNVDSQFFLYFKFLTHSDLPTFAKATRVNDLDANLLYYLTTKEMEEIERINNKPFETAHQSNIGLSNDFWEDLEMNNPRENVSAELEEKQINNYANVYIVNENLDYFSSKYTKNVFDKLDKRIKSSTEWDSEGIDLNTSVGEFTEIQLTQAVHGIGVSEDVEFRKLRHHMFKNDMLYLLIEKKSLTTNLFILPIKNPKFFTLIEETNEVWERYKIRELTRLESQVHTPYYNLETLSRKYQDKWRNLLAEEMMNYTVNDNEVFCPFTFISSKFNELGTIYRASHIKSYSSSNEQEKYDLNNGLLLSANADALFDKHLITISEDKKLIFSFLIKQDQKLISQLLLNQKIFEPVLNEKRMMYVQMHREVFYQKEENRKSNKSLIS